MIGNAVAALSAPYIAPSLIFDYLVIAGGGGGGGGGGLGAGGGAGGLR